MKIDINQIENKSREYWKSKRKSN